MIIQSEKEREFIHKSSKLYEDYKDRIFGLRNGDDITLASNEFYSAIKELAFHYYNGEKMPLSYRYLIRDIFLLDRMMMPEYILPFKEHDFSHVLDKPVSLKNEERVLDYLVDQVRNYLYDEVSFDRSYLSFEAYDLRNKCVDATDFLIGCALNLGVECRKIMLYPCFNRYSGVMEGNVHAFLLVKINEKTYLVDCTYSQFFTKYRCNLNQVGVPLLAGSGPGTFMQYDSFYREVAQTLLTRGWIEYTEKVEKAYLDGFLLSYRNGLFYERTNDFSLTTNYTANDYEQFMYGEDDLFNHERKEELGFQLKPLSNPKLLIKHK